MNARPLLVGMWACAVAAFSCFMIAFNWHQLIDVFRLSDPTGAFGFLMQGGGFVAHICAILVAGLTLASLRTPGLVPRKVMVLVFGSKLLEALSLSPCAFGWGDAFCGFWWVVLSLFTAPLVIAVTLAFLFGARNSALRHLGLALVGSVLVAGALVFVLLTPKNSDSCMALSTVTARAACLNKFAQRDHDARICRQIEFRATRFDCLYNVARDTDTPAICEEIADASESRIAAYETPAAATRSLCYYLLGFKQHSAALCAKIEDEKMRETCLKNAGTSPKR